MIKIGDKVKVYTDPLTCKDLEFVGTIKRIYSNSPESGLLFCRVYDEYYDSNYSRQININNH